MSHQHSNQQSNLQNNDSPSKPNVFTQEKFLPGAHRLKTNTSNNTNSPDLNKPKNEEDDDLGRSYSPSKYFGKRPSFEFRNLKSIEKPLLNRQFSEFKLKDYKSEKTTSKNLENIKVQFKVTEQIIEDEMPGSKSFLKKKANKPILKKAHFVDEVPIECIFKKEINGKFVERIMEDNKIKNQLLEKLLATKFVEYWKEIEKDAQVAIKFLSVSFFIYFIG